MSLKAYKTKRDFKRTSEPASGGGKTAGVAKARKFVIQKHDATRLHYDLRLEVNRVFVSWAVPKGLPMKKGEKRLAVKVEDHPLSYGDFEGTIPKGEYGGGTVQVWDTGHFEFAKGTSAKDLKQGKLHFILHGVKLQGEWYLVRMEDNQWLVIRGGEDHKSLGKEKESASVLTGRTLKQISTQKDPVPTKKVAGTAGKKRVSQKRGRSGDSPVADTILSPLPELIVPAMKAVSVQAIPAGDWTFEVKFDGFRCISYKKGDSVHMLSRTDHDLTQKFPDIAEAFYGVKASEVIMDGEIVALDGEGRSSFQLLQSYGRGSESPPLIYYVFDLISLDGKDMTSLPLEKRKAKLGPLIKKAKQPQLRFSASLAGNQDLLLEKAASLGLEGLIGKKVGSLYESGERSGTWIKLKVLAQQEFVIGGFTPPKGARKHLGALLIGVYDKGKLMYTGKVGTGFNEKLLKELSQEFTRLKRVKCPFVNLPDESLGRWRQGITAAVMKQCTWLKPELVCQVKFTEWTRDGSLRHPVFLGLRTDKAAKDVVREV